MAGTSQRRQRPTVPWGRSYTREELEQTNRWLQRKGYSKRKERMIAAAKKKTSGGQGG